MSGEAYVGQRGGRRVGLMTDLLTTRERINELARPINQGSGAIWEARNRIDGLAAIADQLADRAEAAEADRDRLLVVYRAAEAWAGAVRLLVEIDGDHLSEPSRDLLAALDDYWTPAKVGDTPGELVPGESDEHASAHRCQDRGR